MSNSDELLTKGVFDLRQVLAERQYPEEVITFYVDEELGYAVNKLKARIDFIENQIQVAMITGNTDLEESATKALDAATAKLEETEQAIPPYRATIRSISRRARHDIQSKALHAYPIKRDLLGNDDSENEFARNHYMDQLIWAAFLKKIESPEGQVQTFGGEDFDVVASIMDGIPQSAYAVINAGIDKLMDDGTRFEFAAQEEDFSSES